MKKNKKLLKEKKERYISEKSISERIGNCQRLVEEDQIY